LHRDQDRLLPLVRSGWRTIYRIDLDDALPMLAAARAKAEEIGVKQTICVCDDGGHVIPAPRLPGARLTGVEIARVRRGRRGSAPPPTAGAACWMRPPCWS
ncbi:MAG TPA: heme-binding protein, partial [Jiangellales bacterium]|nr:heme-binding protein [Jiangellales bacterium]